MKYCLDTDTAIDFLKSREPVSSRINEKKIDDLCISAITKAELLYGAYNSRIPKKELVLINNFFDMIEVKPLQDRDLLIFAKEKARLTRRGRLIADLDLMVASICLNHNFILITGNIKHFNRVKGLICEDWRK